MMNPELETPLLVSLIVLIGLIACVVWWYGVRKDKASARVAFKSPGYRDQLTLISGIGATLERKLNGLGITSFKQIAEFDQSAIERVNEELAFKGRIEREGWIAQAKKLVEAGSRGGPNRGAARGTKTKAGAGKRSKRKTGGKTGAAGYKAGVPSTRKSVRKATKKRKTRSGGKIEPKS